VPQSGEENQQRGQPGRSRRHHLGNERPASHVRGDTRCSDLLRKRFLRVTAFPMTSYRSQPDCDEESGGDSVGRAAGRAGSLRVSGPANRL
jgi:hypothetical protein